MWTLTLTLTLTMKMGRLGALLICGLLAGAHPSAMAQPAAPTAIEIKGKTFQGKDFDLSKLQGKVVMVMFWSTQCAVCLNKMSELRANYAAWRDKSFELVLVSQDPKLSDATAYEMAVTKLRPNQPPFVQLWAGEVGYKDNVSSDQWPRTVLPMSYVLDKTGKVVQTFKGRIPADAWDMIADLL
jgi:thiol-disulfide isomerase/thioredoxin